MTFFGKLRLYVVVLALFYTVYLSTYKCPQVKLHPLEQSAKSIFDPLASTHKNLCGALDHAHLVLTPHANKLHLVLHHHTKDYLHKYDVPAHFETAKGHYSAHVHPWVTKLFEAVESAELQVFHHGYNLYVHLENHFHSTVVPKAAEFKDAVVEHAESLKDQVQTKLE